MQKTDKHPSLLSESERRRRERMDERSRRERAQEAKSIILGSASPWRAKVLRDAGIPFTVMSADIDEKAIRDADPYRLARRIATAKAAALLSRIHEPAFLVTADQVICFRSEMREKPRDASQAREWLSQYRGRTVQTVTGVFVIDVLRGVSAVGHDVATVGFGDYPDEVVDALLANQDSGVLQSCGALIHEHRAMAPYARCYRQHDEHDIGPAMHAAKHGSDPDAATSVSGLPLNTTLRLLRRIGWKQ